jgi:hypothetical protein
VDCAQLTLAAARISDGYGLVGRSSTRPDTRIWARHRSRTVIVIDVRSTLQFFNRFTLFIDSLVDCRKACRHD